MTYQDHQHRSLALLRLYLSRRPGSETTLDDIAKEIGQDPLTTWVLCCEAAREGWLHWNEDQTVVLYTP